MFEKYYGSSLYLKAPNGKDSRLDEPLWIAVRTPTFKKWFGDWETLAIINEVENMPASAIKLHESLDKAGIKEAFKSFGEVENKRDGRVVVFPNSIAGKIQRHKGFPTDTVIKNLKALFEDSIHIFSEREILKEGHKVHRSYESYEHYINKFVFNGNEYFIRFTVPVIKNNPSSNNVHSTAISEVTVYKNERASTVVSAYNNAKSDVSISGKGGSSQFIDDKILHFLNSVNKKDVSQVVDENGEPLVVYHGSGSTFYEFKGEFTGKGNDQYGSGFYFTTSKENANGYAFRRISDDVEKLGGEDSPNVVAGFLSIKNPIVISNGREIPNLRDITVSAKQAYEIIKRAPHIMDNENSILGDFFESYWSDGASDSLVKKLAEMNPWDLMTLENDVFRGESTAFRKAVNEVLGYDGVQINFPNGEKHFVSWFPNQIKSAYGNAKFNPNDANIYREPSVGGANVAADASNAVFNPNRIKSAADNIRGNSDAESKGDSRYVAERFDATPRPEGWSKEEADSAFDDLWNALGGEDRLAADEMRKLEKKIDAFTKKIDPRMIELPEVLSSSVVPLA